MHTPAPSLLVPIDRRVRDRIVLDAQLVLQFGVDASWVETDAALVDLSYDGMLVRCDRMPTMSQRAFLIIHHALFGECVALGSPVRFGSGGFGVHFQHTNDPMRQMVSVLSEVNTDPGAYLLGAASALRVQVSGGRPAP